MSWVRIGQDVNIALGLGLIVRLLTLRLQRVYRIFCLFLLAEFGASLIAFGKAMAPEWLPDYRISWMIGRAVIWIFTLWTVYALLEAVLSNLPGILRFSRKLLNWVFVVAIFFGLITARAEYLAARLPRATDGIDQAVGVSFVLDRVVCTIALFALVAILGFLVWFPVEISKNLVVFTTGFLVYFVAKAALLLTRSVWSHESIRLMSNLILFISSACFAYWAVFISKQGEAVPIRIGHGWAAHDHERLVTQLEGMNTALLRASARRNPTLG